MKSFSMENILQLAFSKQCTNLMNNTAAWLPKADAILCTSRCQEIINFTIDFLWLLDKRKQHALKNGFISNLVNRRLRRLLQAPVHLIIVSTACRDFRSRRRLQAPPPISVCRDRRLLDTSMYCAQQGQRDDDWKKIAFLCSYMYLANYECCKYCVD
jgi:hypothetical protein